MEPGGKLSVYKNPPLVHMNPPLIAVQSCLNSFLTLRSCFFKIHHNVLPSKPQSAKWSPAIRFLTENSICCSYLSMHAACPTLLILLDLNLRCTAKIGMVICVLIYLYFISLLFRMEQETSSSVTVVCGT